MKNIAARFIGMKDRWSIGIYTGDSPYHLTAPDGLKNPVLTARQVTDRRAEFVADPFMVKEKDLWYMFFEVLDSGSHKADIGLAISRDGFHWQYQQIVLSEPFHLSYPYVFLWDNTYYMVPESFNGHEVRLYKAVEFPLRWSFQSTLIYGNFSDSSIFRYRDFWWMLTAGQKEGPVRNDILRLFYSSNLMGPWQEHCKSPVIRDNLHIARPGGRVLITGDRIVRYAQDDYGIYGNRVHAFEVTKLSTLDYEEKPMSNNPLLEASGRGWNKDGMHTIDPYPIGENQWIACVDGNARYLGFRGSQKQ